MSRRSQRDLFDAIAHAERHGAFDDDLGRRLLEAFEVDPSAPWIQGLVAGRARAFERRVDRGIEAPFPRPKLPKDGELFLGFGPDGAPRRYRLQWLSSGVLCVGNTGAAKTSLLIWLAVQIILRGARVLLTDAYKTHLRHVGALLARAGHQLVVLDAKRWKWNLLQAGCLDPNTYLPMAIDVLQRILHLPSRARSILFQVAWRLYDRFGIWRGRTDSWPCLFDMYEEVKRLGSRVNAAARESALDRVGALLTSATPACAAYRLAWDPVDLARFNLTIELRHAGETLKQALVQPLLFTLLHHRIQTGAPNRELEVVLALDDSQRLTIDRSASGDLDPLAEAAGIIRGGGTGLYCNFQTLHGVSPRLATNLATKISGRLGGGADGHRIASDLGMNPEQLRWATLHQQTGTFVATVPGWREPFLFQIPRFELPPVVTDDHAAGSRRALDSLPVVPATEYADWKPSHLLELATDEPGDTPPSLSDAEVEFLRAVIAEPGKASSYYTRQLRMGGTRSTQIRRKLVRDGYLRETPVATGRRGRNALIIEPLEAAYAAVDHAG